MIRCHLSRLMGERRVRLMDVARATRISRNMLAKLYYDRARRIDLGDLNKLCHYFSCSVGDLLESVPDRSAHREKKGKNISP
jgi:putative transcriptional regulator